MAYKVPDLHHKDCSKYLAVAMAAGDERMAALEELAAFKARVVVLLRSMEFAVMADNQWGDGVEYHCPCCGGKRFEDDQHCPDCELSALLKEVER